MRRARVLAFGGVLAFWVGVLVAGALVEGYSPREDYISSLASRGSPVAALVIAALLASAVAHAAASSAVWRAWRSRVLAGLLLLAALATATVAVFRASCAGGPAGCGLTGASEGDWVDVVHGGAVGLYELFILAAMLTLLLGSLRRTPRWPRWLGLASLAFAAGSVLLIARTEGDDIGLWQRLWLADNLAWLLVVAWVATARDPAREADRYDRGDQPTVG